MTFLPVSEAFAEPSLREAVRERPPSMSSDLHHLTFAKTEPLHDPVWPLRIIL